MPIGFWHNSIMTSDLEMRIISFIGTIAKQCDKCQRRQSSACQTCIGTDAKSILRDINMKPWTEGSEQVELSMLAKLFDKEFRTVSNVARDCGVSWGVCLRAANRLAKDGVIEMRGNG
jgi:hypothetical protein